MADLSRSVKNTILCLKRTTFLINGNEKMKQRNNNVVDMRSRYKRYHYQINDVFGVQTSRNYQRKGIILQTSFPEKPFPAACAVAEKKKRECSRLRNILPRKLP